MLGLKYFHWVIVLSLYHNYFLLLFIAEKELVEFLAEEIIAEKNAQKLKTIPTQLDGFKVSLDGADVNLEKKQDNET